MERCIVCGKIPSGEAFQDVRGHVVCKHHKDMVKTCGCCHAFLDDLSKATFVGCDTYICDRCMEYHVNEDNIERYISMTLQILYKYGFQDIQRDWIKIWLISREDMEELLESNTAVGVHFERTPSRLSIEGRSDFDQWVCILDYLSPIEFMQVLAHEAIHAWHLQNNIEEFDRYGSDETCAKACEGFAQIGSYIIYDFFDSKRFNQDIRAYAQFKKVILMNSEDETYGIPLQKLLSVFPSTDEERFLKLIRIARKSKLSDCIV